MSSRRGTWPVILATAVAVALPGIAGRGAVPDHGAEPPEQQQRFAPHEWESITVTRFVRSVATGPRYVGVGTEGGLLIYDRVAHRWRNPLTSADGLPDNVVLEVSFTADGRMLVVTRAEQGVVDPSVARYTPDPFARPAPLEQPAGLPPNLFTGPGYQYLSNGAIGGPAGLIAPVMTRAADDDAGLWLGTWGLGSGRADLRTLSLEMLPQGLWSADVRALALLDGSLVAAGIGDFQTSGGISVIDPDGGGSSYLLAAEEIGLRSDRVYGLAAEGRRLWVATDQGLARRDSSGRWRTWTRAQGLPGQIATAVTVAAGSVWVGTDHGAAVVTADTLTTVAVPGSAVVLDIAATEGAVWWATTQGVYGYRGAWPGGSLARLEHPRGRLDGQVDAAGAWKDEVWFAGAAGVVAYDAAAGTWQEVPPVGSFSPGEVSDIALDEENVWLATGDGVLRLIREAGTWHRYGPEDGLIGRPVQAIVLEGSLVWLGTARGVSRFDTRLRRRTP